MNYTGQGPERNKESRAVIETRSLARLYGAIWDASQLKTEDELRAYFEGVLRDIKSDEE